MTRTECAIGPQLEQKCSTNADPPLVWLVRMTLSVIECFVIIAVPSEATGVQASLSPTLFAAPIELHYTGICKISDRAYDLMFPDKEA